MILAIDSSASVTSCALVQNEKVIASFDLNAKVTHSQVLMPMIENILSYSNTDISSIDGIAISIGPGSFTGLRIGIGAVKGLAFVDNIPCYPVSTLLALAYNYHSDNATIVSVMDARASQVYTATFTACSGEIIRVTEDCTIKIEQVIEHINTLNNPIIVGDGAMLFSHLQNVTIAPIDRRFQSATSVAFASLSTKPVSCNELAPEYLKLPQAQQELLNKKL